MSSEGYFDEEIKKHLDEIFQFKIGDVVQVKAMGDYIEKPTGLGYHNTTKDGDTNSWITLHFSEGKFLYQVVERLLQQCHGGIQKHYALRMVRSDGLVERQLLQLTEGELTLSAPFRKPKELTKEEALTYAKEHLK